MNQEETIQDQPIVEVSQLSVKDILENERIRGLKKAGAKIAKALIATVAFQVAAHVISRKIENALDRRFTDQDEQPDDETCFIDQIPAETDE